MDRYSEALERQIEAIDRFRNGFYRAPLRVVAEEAARQGIPINETDIALDILPPLLAAEPYYWAPHMVALLQTAGDAFPGAGYIADHVVPQTGAFWWLSTPLEIRPWGADRLTWRVHAMLSHRVLRPLTNPLDGRVMAPDGFVVCTCWMSANHNGRWGEPAPVFTVPWATGIALDGLRTLAEGRPSGGSGRSPAEIFLPYFGAGWALLEQRILDGVVARPERSVRKRADRAGLTHEPLVRVIELRRKEARHRDGDAHEAVEWSCQWLVRGHWRQQWYASLGRHQPKWIAPHIKGPDDKPLRPSRATVYAVVR